MSFHWTTLALQLVNVLILLAILKHFLFRPVAAIIAARQAATDAAMQAATDAQAAAEAAAQKAGAEAQATLAARTDVLAAAQAEAEAARKAALDAARDEAARIVAAGRAAREAETRTAEALALARARDLAGAIAARALAAQPAGIAGYATRLAEALTALPAAERTALLTGGNLRLVSATALPDTDMQAVTAALAPFHITPDQTVDPALIAGLDLVSDAGAVRNSLAHDLAQIEGALRDDRG